MRIGGIVCVVMVVPVSLHSQGYPIYNGVSGFLRHVPYFITTCPEVSQFPGENGTENEYAYMYPMLSRGAAKTEYDKSGDKRNEYSDFYR